MEDTINKFFKIAGGAVKSFSDGLKTLNDINPKEVTDILDNITIKKSQYTTEKNIEKIIADALDIAIGKTHRQYNIGGFLGLKVDIDLGDGQVGIEIKMAKELTATNIERLFGQVLYYSKRVYKSNLIVLIVGTEKEQTQILKEIEDIIESQGVVFYYLTVK
jgi:hypothetical protein